VPSAAFGQPLDEPLDGDLVTNGIGQGYCLCVQHALMHKTGPQLVSSPKRRFARRQPPGRRDGSTRVLLRQTGSQSNLAVPGSTATQSPPRDEDHRLCNR
jgi:hypothetical protein